MRAFLDVTQRERGVDDAEMGERLRKISQSIAGFGIDLFREKIHIIGETERGLVNLVRFFQSATSREKIRFPKTAKRERAFVSIFALLVAMDQSDSRNEPFANPCVSFLHSL